MHIDCMLESLRFLSLDKSRTARVSVASDTDSCHGDTGPLLEWKIESKHSVLCTGTLPEDEFFERRSVREACCCSRAQDVVGEQEEEEECLHVQVGAPQQGSTHRDAVTSESKQGLCDGRTSWIANNAPVMIATLALLIGGLISTFSILVLGPLGMVLVPFVWGASVYCCTHLSRTTPSELARQCRHALDLEARASLSGSFELVILSASSRTHATTPDAMCLAKDSSVVKACAQGEPLGGAVECYRILRCSERHLVFDLHFREQSHQLLALQAACFAVECIVHQNTLAQEAAIVPI